MFFRYVLNKIFKLRENKGTEMVKPFLDHLEDLRWMLVKIVAVLGTAVVLCFAFRFQLAAVVERPLHNLNANIPIDLQALGPVDSMTISMNLALYAGIVLSFPLLLYFVAQFVLPALNQAEKRYVLPAVGAGFGLFLCGVMLCFNWILPATLHFLFYDQIRMGFRPNWTVPGYFSFATQFVLIFGLMFELPVVVIVLVKLGLLQADLLRTTRAYAMVIILVVAIIIAPTPDPISMLFVAGPMLALYEACIWIAWWMERRERRLKMRPTRPLEEPKD